VAEAVTYMAVSALLSIAIVYVVADAAAHVYARGMLWWLRWQWRRQHRGRRR